MNLVNQWFPPKEDPDKQLSDNLMMVMHYFGLSKKELDELYIPQYIALRDYAIEKIKEENSQMNKMMPKMRKR